MKQLLLTIALTLVCAVPPAMADDGKSGSGTVLASALVWLSLVDSGDYIASWENAAEPFRQATTSGQWRQAATAARTPFGRLLSRKLATADPKQSLPGAPDGEYMVMQFASSFEKKSAGAETVTFLRERDGVWRAVGYFVK